MPGMSPAVGRQRGHRAPRTSGAAPQPSRRRALGEAARLAQILAARQLSRRAAVAFHFSHQWLWWAGPPVAQPAPNGWFRYMYAASCCFVEHWPTCTHLRPHGNILGHAWMGSWVQCGQAQLASGLLSGLARPSHNGCRWRCCQTGAGFGLTPASRAGHITLPSPAVMRGPDAGLDATPHRSSALIASTAPGCGRAPYLPFTPRVQLLQ